jgi:hypothetical protein
MAPPLLDEVFWGHRPTEQGSDNRLYLKIAFPARWALDMRATIAES